MKVKIMKVVVIILLIILTIYMSIGLYTFSVVSKYDNKLYPNMYIDNYNISNLSKDDVRTSVDSFACKMEENEVILVAGNVEYKYHLKDLGITINKDKLSNDILTYDKNLNSFEKMKKIVNREKTFFKYNIQYSKEDLVEFINNLKKTVDKKLIQGKLVMGSDRVLYYDKGQSSFSLDVQKTIAKIEMSIDNILNDNKLELVGTIENPKYNELSTINTKVSTFTTEFNHKVSRGRNIEFAAKNLDGVILKPGEVFSFYKFAGPYTKKGYIYYDGVIGNGVCQVATTIYNVELLAGLKTVERYSHAYKMVYVDGGLDATVASTNKASKVDFKFKNTYKYPIYISAFTNKGKLTIEFWSNDKAKNGNEYKTKSVKIAPKGYKTYLVTYKNGKQVSEDFIATTWYPK